MFYPDSPCFPAFSSFSPVSRFFHDLSPFFSLCFLTRVLKGELILARPLYPLAGVISSTYWKRDFVRVIGLKRGVMWFGQRTGPGAYCKNGSIVKKENGRRTDFWVRLHPTSFFSRWHTRLTEIWHFSRETSRSIYKSTRERVDSRN